MGMKMASMKAKSKKVVKGAAACDGTDCPAGCCVGEYDWFCCADGQYCAATEDDCPAPKMTKMASMKPKSKKVVKGLTALLAAVLENMTGFAAQMTSTVLPLKMT